MVVFKTMVDIYIPTAFHCFHLAHKVGLKVVLSHFLIQFRIFPVAKLIHEPVVGEGYMHSNLLVMRIISHATCMWKVNFSRRLVEFHPVCTN